MAGSLGGRVVCVEPRRDGELVAGSRKGAGGEDGGGKEWESAGWKEDERPPAGTGFFIWRKIECYWGKI